MSAVTETFLVKKHRTGAEEGGRVRCRLLAISSVSELRSCGEKVLTVAHVGGGVLPANVCWYHRYVPLRVNRGSATTTDYLTLGKHDKTLALSQGTNQTLDSIECDLFDLFDLFDIYEVKPSASNSNPSRETGPNLKVHDGGLVA